MNYVGKKRNPQSDIVLVIDTDMDIIHLMVSILASSEYQVLFATDLEKGLKMARADRPDIILLNINIPRMSSRDMVKELKAFPETRHIPVIFTSSLGDLESKIEAFDRGAVERGKDRCAIE